MVELKIPLSKFKQDSENGENMNSRQLLVMGTFRTGSTFLSRALSAHKNIAVASDPYFHFFKSLRNEIYLREENKNFDIQSPLSDNFFSKYLEINQKIRKKTLDISIESIKLQSTIENIALLTKRDSPKVISHLRNINAKNYRELFDLLMNIVQISYGNRSTIYCGFKSTFTEQFLEPLLNTYNDIKCIFLIRDPRAIVASSNRYYENPENKIKYPNRGRYPLLYVIRQWRKSIAYYLDNCHRTENILLVRYEDMVSRPYEIFSGICNFLELEFDENMINPEKYLDGEGKHWIQNSSYGAYNSINKKSMKIWKEVLSNEEVRFVEDCCSPEMHKFGYTRTSKSNLFSAYFDCPRDDLKKIDPWLFDYIDAYMINEKEFYKEIIRNNLTKLDCKNQKGSDFLEKIFIGKDYLNRLKNYTKTTIE